MHLRSREEQLIKDEQETNDAKDLFHESPQSDETSTEIWRLPDADNLFEKISSIFE